MIAMCIVYIRLLLHASLMCVCVCVCSGPQEERPVQGPINREPSEEMGRHELVARGLPGLRRSSSHASSSSSDSPLSGGKIKKLYAAHSCHSSPRPTAPLTVHRRFLSTTFAFRIPHSSYSKYFSSCFKFEFKVLSVVSCILHTILPKDVPIFQMIHLNLLTGFKN